MADVLNLAPAFLHPDHHWVRLRQVQAHRRHAAALHHLFWSLVRSGSNPDCWIKSNDVRFCVLMDPELTDCFRLKAEIRLTVLDNGSCRVAQRNFTPGRSQNRA
jgi:hypothetical protein